VVNGWPTGVAVGWAQQHGGPWPATSSPAHTSVGAAALDRFTRPVAYQDVPDGALPPALREGNPWRLPRRVDGILAL
jgi:NADP-dependent aldehyde dehydrogenase